MVPNSGKVELGDTCFTDASQGVQRPLRAKAKGNQCQLAAGLQPRYSRTKRKEDDKDGLGLRHSCFCAFFTPPFCLIYDFMYNGAQSPRTCRRVLCAVSRQHERSDFPSAAAVTAKGPAVSRRERATHGQRCVLQRLERLRLPRDHRTAEQESARSHSFAWHEKTWRT